MTYSPRPALDEFEVDLRARLHVRPSAGFSTQKVHRHRRPLQARDRTVGEGDGAAGASHRCRPTLPCAWCGSAAARFGCPRRWPKPPSAALRLLSASIRKFAADHDRFALLHAFEHLDVAVAARAESHLARLETSLAELRPARRCRVPESSTAESGTASTLALRGPTRIPLARTCAGLSRPPGIGQFDAHLHRARLRLQRRIDERDSAVGTPCPG